VSGIPETNELLVEFLFDPDLRYVHVRSLTQRVVERHADFCDSEIKHVYL
jgi:hypothetical protein